MTEHVDRTELSIRDMEATNENLPQASYSDRRNVIFTLKQT